MQAQICLKRNHYQLFLCYDKNDVLPGVLVTQGLWWEDHQIGRQAVNTLTPQRLADMGGGATFFSNRVEVLCID